jgi:hypothetical protein
MEAGSRRVIAPRYPLVVRHSSLSGIVGDSVLTAFAAGGAVWMAFYLLEAWFMAILVLGAAVIAVFFAWNGIKTATHVTTFEADAVTVRDAFGEHRLVRSEVAGWRSVDPIGAVPCVELRRKGDGRPPFLMVSVPRPEGEVIDPAIEAWFAGLDNLADKERTEAIRAIQADANLGHTPDERMQNALREERILRALNAVALGLLIWVFVWPVPYWYAIGTASVFATALALLTLIRRDRWCFERGAADLRPQTGSIIFLVTIGLAGRAFFDWRIVDVALLAGIVALFAIVCVALVATLARERLQREQIVAWLAVAALYGYGTITPLNHWFDPARSESFRAVVQEKHNDAVRIGPWGPITASRDEQVSDEALEDLKVGSEVCVTLYRGALRVRSYFVDPCATESEAAR